MCDPPPNPQPCEHHTRLHRAHTAMSTRPITRHPSNTCIPPGPPVPECRHHQAAPPSWAMATTSLSPTPPRARRAEPARRPRPSSRPAPAAQCLCPSLPLSSLSPPHLKISHCHKPSMDTVGRRGRRALPGSTTTRLLRPSPQPPHQQPAQGITGAGADVSQPSSRRPQLFSHIPSRPAASPAMPAGRLHQNTAAAGASRARTST